MAGPENLYWDSCVFIRYLTGIPSDLLADIEQYISEAKRGLVTIHFSTVTFAEIRPRYLKQRSYLTIKDLFSDLGSAFIPFDPNPNIMISAGIIRDSEPINTSAVKVPEEHKRSIGMGDAIHLATCLYLKSVLGLSDIEFHTFDEGKGKTWEGKCVPLLGFENWFPSNGRSKIISDICDLKRVKPKHPTPDLVTGAATSIVRH